MTRIAVQDGVLVEVAIVERYVQKVVEVLSEFVPSERLRAAVGKLKQISDEEAFGTEDDTKHATEDAATN